MNPWRWVDPRIREVRLEDVRRFFDRRGWRLRPNPSPNLLKFERPAAGDGAAMYQMVPSSERFADFRQRVMELITTLSELEDRHPVELLEEMLQSRNEDADGAGGKQAR
jgi:hypothetical protein